MSRIGNIVIRIQNDVAGKPYVLIEGDPQTERDLRDASPVRLVLWADDVRVEDTRSPR